MKVYNRTYVPDQVETDIYNRILASDKHEKKLHGRIKELNRKTGFFLVNSEKDLPSVKKAAIEMNLDKIILVTKEEVESSEVLQENVLNY